MNPITQAITQFFSDLVNNILNGIDGAITPLVNLIGNTPLEFTTANAVVNATWLTMTALEDGLLGIYVITKLIQMMYGDATGTVHKPLGQFMGRAILTIILIHASAFLGQQLILLMNALCDLVRVNIQDFVGQVNGGKPFDTNQGFGLSVVLGLVFGFGLIRLVFQAAKRVVFFNVLYVFSGPAFLMSLDEQTKPWFQFWFRTYMTTILTQFFQFLTFGLGFQFLIATKQTGFTGFMLAIAMLYLTAEIPGLLSRFAASSGANEQGLNGLVRGAAVAAALFI